MKSLTLKCRYFRRYPPEEFLGYMEQALEIDLSRTAFLVVDVYGLGLDQEDDKPSDKPGMVTAASVNNERQVILDSLLPALTAARQASLGVIYVSNSAPRVALDRYEFARQRNRNAEHDFESVFAETCIDPREYTYGDSAFIKFSHNLQPQGDEPFVRKIVYSGFFETRLDALLRHRRVDTLVCVGFSESECLLSTMIDALYRNYRVILLRDCTLATETVPEEEATLAFTQRMVLWVETYLGWSSTSRDFIAACHSLADPSRS